MSLDVFLHDLHFDMDRTRPPDWEVDWEDAPLAYKLYRGLPAVPLSAEIPLTLEGRETPVKPVLREIGHLLWYTFGLSQLSQSFFTSDTDDQAAGLSQSCRRFAPSGGGLYSSELYVYLKLDDVPAGVYHYDAAHHRLVLLREGRFDAYLDRSLGGRCEMSACFAAVFVSAMFWKNFFKYHNLSYRLQGLDAGVLIGQLLEAAKRFGFAAGVYFQFLDQAVNHLIGLAKEEESVYAVIPLSEEPAGAWFGSGKTGDGTGPTAAQLCGELPVVRHHHYVRSRRMAAYPMLVRMNEASLLESAGAFRQVGEGRSACGEGQAAALPQVRRLSYDLASASRKRYSPGMDFALGKVSRQQLAELFQETMASFLYQNDLDEEQESGQRESRVCLHGCLYNVEGIPNGAYRYDSAAHALRQIRPGDQRARLQLGTPSDVVNLFQVPLCLHVSGDRGHLKAELGYRGYRIQQMEAGMLVQRLLLAASALGLGGHPLLAFDAGLCDELYRITPQGKTSLIQIAVGPYRHRPRLRGGAARLAIGGKRIRPPLHGRGGRFASFPHDFTANNDHSRTGHEGGGDTAMGRKRDTAKVHGARDHPTGDAKRDQIHRNRRSHNLHEDRRLEDSDRE